MAAALPALNSSEFQQNKAFAQVWVKATAEWQKQRSKSSALSPAQAIAVMAYTMNDVYEQFNAAVRTAGKSSQQYRDNFHFKTLHFLLTQALQKLRDPNKCWNVCRGAKPVQSTLKVGETVRFGQFASSSLKKDEAQCFEKGAMFEVYTCHGADIHEFSRYQYEQEVLIPPFETFQVIDVKKESRTMKIVLRSTGNSSNYNCEWLRGDITGTTKVTEVTVATTVTATRRPCRGSPSKSCPAREQRQGSRTSPGGTEQPGQRRTAETGPRRSRLATSRQRALGVAMSRPPPNAPWLPYLMYHRRLLASCIINVSKT